MLRFVRNVVPPMCPSIPAVTDIVQNANNLSRRSGLKLRCPNFYQWVTSTPFSIPQELNILVLQNQRLLYSLLIKSAGHTLMELAKDPKFLGATIGITSVLHTWGQNLAFHPHVHCIVPGGGLSNDGLRFIRSRKKFFIPVKVISKKFRGKFLDLLKQAYNKGEIAFFNEATKLALRSNFLSLVDTMYNKNWVVFCKKPFKSPGHVVRYLGRYTHRVAISNSRILAFDGESVSFAWRDYKDDNKSKVMTLDASEFTRRFLMHVLPNRFVKIRHYGILCSRNIRSKLSKCMKLTGNKPMHLNIKQKKLKFVVPVEVLMLLQFLFHILLPQPQVHDRDQIE